MKGLWKNQKGMSILQVLVMGSILSGLAVFVANSQKETAKIIKGDRFTEDVEFLTEKVEAVLMDRDYCTELISTSLPVPGNLPADSTYYDITSLRGATLGEVLSVTNTTDTNPVRYGMTGDVNLSSIQIRRTTENDARLKLTFSFNEEAVGVREVVRFIPIKVEGTAPAINKCFGDPSGAIADAVYRYCHGLGAFYDPDKVECIIVGVTATTCATGELMKGMSFNPTTFMVTPVCAAPSSSSAVAVSNCTNSGQDVPVGINADGSTNCRNLAPYDLLTPNLLDLAKKNCPSQTHRLIVSGGKVTFECQALESLNISTFMPITTPIPMTKNTNLFMSVRKVNGANESGTQVTPYTGTVNLSLYADSECATPLNLATYSCTGLVTGTGPITASSNKADFSVFKANCDLPSTFYLRASDGTNQTACRPMAFSGGAPSYHLELSNVPSSALSATYFSPLPSVTIKDQNNATKTTDSTTAVTLSAFTDASCTSAAPGIFSSTPNPRTVSSGTTTFTATMYNQPGNIYLKATAAGAAAACAGPINITNSSPPVCNPRSVAWTGGTSITIWGQSSWRRTNTSPKITVTGTSVTIDCISGGCTTSNANIILWRDIGNASGIDVTVSEAVGTPGFETTLNQDNPVLAEDICGFGVNPTQADGATVETCYSVENQSDYNNMSASPAITYPHTFKHYYYGGALVCEGHNPNLMPGGGFVSPVNTASSGVQAAVWIYAQNGEKITVSNVTVHP